MHHHVELKELPVELQDSLAVLPLQSQVEAQSPPLKEPEVSPSPKLKPFRWPLPHLSLDVTLLPLVPLNQQTCQEYLKNLSRRAWVHPLQPLLLVAPPPLKNPSAPEEQR